MQETQAGQSMYILLESWPKIMGVELWSIVRAIFCTVVAGMILKRMYEAKRGDIAGRGEQSRVPPSGATAERGDDPFPELRRPVAMPLQQFNNIAGLAGIGCNLLLWLGAAMMHDAMRDRAWKWVVFYLLFVLAIAAWRVSLSISITRIREQAVGRNVAYHVVGVALVLLWFGIAVWIILS